MTPASVQPALLVTIDTEEEGLWSGKFRGTDNTVENLKGIPRFQALCDEFAIRPTYLIDSPVATDRYGVELLSGYQSAGLAEIGAHLHPWCTPPGAEDCTARNSYLCNLPAAQQRAKLETLVEQITRGCGVRPTAFRAGRYGLGLSAARDLVDLGFIVDSSVIPFSDFSNEGGPDFSAANWRPYRMAADDILKADPEGPLLELPVGVGFTRPHFESAWKWRRWAAKSPWSRLRMEGILDRLGVCRRVKLSPEQSNAPQMLRFIQNSLSQGAPCAVLMFHSSSLVPGFSPYVQTSQDLDEFYRRLRSVFETCLGAWKMSAPTLTDFSTRFLARQTVKLWPSG